MSGGRGSDDDDDDNSELAMGASVGVGGGKRRDATSEGYHRGCLFDLGGVIDCCYGCHDGDDGVRSGGDDVGSSVCVCVCVGYVLCVSVLCVLSVVCVVFCFVFESFLS